MSISDLPALALSVRQPWAWAIIHGGKDVENRTSKAISFMNPMFGGRAIHAAKGMTRDEYESAHAFMASLGVRCPPPADLPRGGIIGCVYVQGVVKESSSYWFFGPRGLVLADPRPHAFVPAIGALGYFAWHPSGGAADPPLRWMLPRSDGREGTAPRAPDLFAE